MPQQHHQSRLSSSVEAVEAAANNILAGIASRTSGEKSTPPTIRTHTSLGSILPTHVTSTTTHSTATSLPPPSSTTPATIAHPLSTGGGGGGHTIIDIPSDGSSHGYNNPNSISTISIPVQTGPIYFLCSLSDFPPAQPAGPTAAKKGKAVVTSTGSSSNNNTSGRLRRDGSSRSSSSRGLNASHIPSQSASSAAAAAAARVGATSPLSLPGSSSRRQGSRHRREDGVDSEDEEGEMRDGAEEEEDEEDEELSPIMAPQATGFDRLREAGFSEDEIQSIRRQFHASRGTVTSTVGENGIAVGLDQDEDASARARRIEEEWIDQHGAETLPEGRKYFCLLFFVPFLRMWHVRICLGGGYGFVDQRHVYFVHKRVILKLLLFFLLLHHATNSGGKLWRDGVGSDAWLLYGIDCAVLVQGSDLFTATADG